MNKPNTSLQVDQAISQLLGELEPREQESQLDFYRYWQAILKRKWGILGLTLVATIAALLYAFSLEPRYQAVALLDYEPKSRTYGTVQDVVTMQTYDFFRSRTMFATQQQVMRTRNFAERVVDRLELWDHPFFDPTKEKVSRASLQIDWERWLPEWTPQRVRNYLVKKAAVTVPPQSVRRAQAINAVRAGISVGGIEETSLLQLGFESSDPEFAAEMANKISELFIEYDLESRLETYQSASSWLTTRAEELREQMKASELAMQEFREKEQDFINGRSITSEELDGAWQRLKDNRSALEQVEDAYRQLDAINQLGLAAAAQHPVMLSYPAVQAAYKEAVAAAEDLQKLSGTYGPKHPAMVAAVTRNNKTIESLQAAIGKTVQEIVRNYQGLRKSVAENEAAFEQLRAESQKLERKRFQLSALERNLETDRQLYDLFVNRFKETSIGSDVETPNARIVDKALIPGAPYWPNPYRIAMMWGAVALMLGIGFALLREFMDNTIKGAEEVESKLGLPLLGTLQLLVQYKGEKEINPERHFVENQRSAFAESIRTIRTGVMLSGLDNPHKVISVTSTVPGEGKTTVSMNLAMALGQLEKVLLIDADMRRASIGRKLGFEKNAPGLSDLVAGIKDMPECIHHLELGNIDVLPAGTIPPNPQELLSSERFSHVMDEFRRIYDRIVIDTAPTHVVSDAKVVARESNAIVYVVHAESTPYLMARDMIKQLQQSGTPILGAVLNRFNESSGGRYYGRYSRYGRYGKYGRYGSYGRYGRYQSYDYY